MAVMAPVFELTDLERKLLRLALCRSAQLGEITTSAVKFVQSLRDRNVESVLIETVLDGGSNDVEPAIRMSHPDYGLVVMPWGKHKGEMFMDIPPNYLRWARHWILQDEERAQRFQDLAASIEQFLQQT